MNKIYLGFCIQARLHLVAQIEDDNSLDIDYIKEHFQSCLECKSALEKLVEKGAAQSGIFGLVLKQGFEMMINK